jgi:hypothetical protein
MSKEELQILIKQGEGFIGQRKTSVDNHISKLRKLGLAIKRCKFMPLNNVNHKIE